MAKYDKYFVKNIQFVLLENSSYVYKLGANHWSPFYVNKLLKKCCLPLSITKKEFCHLATDASYLKREYHWVYGFLQICMSSEFQRLCMYPWKRLAYAFFVTIYGKETYYKIIV